jgi:hypothetical protein
VKRWPKIFVALLAQGMALAVLTLGVMLAPAWIAPPYPYWLLVLVQGTLAAVLGSWLGLPSWWRWIALMMPLGLYGALSLGVNPWWGLGLFVLIGLVFSNAGHERVPLYLTNSITRQALKQLAAEQVALHNGEQAVRFIDLGCGLGGNVVFMANAPKVQLAHGVETAPIPYLLSKLNTALRGGQTFAMDLWKVPLTDYNLVYAFLSPEPMAILWQKVQQELPCGAVFVSNSFAVPDVEPTEIWTLDDSRQTQLFIYKMT